MRITSGLQIVAMLATLSACTTAIHSTQVAADKPDVPNGVLYYLPATAISASASFVPTSCKLGNGGKVEFTYDISNALVAHSYVPDADQQYVFDYSKLNSKLKITTASVELYGIGAIKSINTSVDDRTAEVIGAVGSTALNLVKAAAYVPGVAVSAGTKTISKCPTVITRTLADLDTARSDLLKAKASDEPLQVKLGELDDAKAALGAAKEKAAAAPNDAALKAEVARLASKAAKLEADVKGKSLAAPGIQKKIAALLNVLTGSARTLFVPTVSKRCGEATMSGASYLRQFQKAVSNEDEQKQLQDQIDLVDQDAVFTAAVCVKTANGALRKTAQKLGSLQTQDQEVPPGGIVYRQPIMAQVTVSQTENDIVDFSGERWISIPQYGTMASLDLVNGPFDKNTLKLAFAEDGALATLDFTAQSSAERGALAAQNLSKTYLDIVTARENAKVARDNAVDAKEKKERADEIAKYDDELKLLNAKNALAAKVLGKDPVQAQIEAAELETALLKKQIELETARQNLTKLKASAP